jgi:ATP-dependent Lhr-like helicase
MRKGLIEETRYPRNPLDVLAQQVVAMVAMDEWSVDELAALVRRSAPFAELTDDALTAVLDLLSGRYPSDEFADLKPRLVWDRVGGVLRGRSGAQRIAVTNAGTIPDRGSSGCSCPTARASASSTRRWSTRAVPVTPSCSGRRRGGSRRSPTTASS